MLTTSVLRGSFAGAPSIINDMQLLRNPVVLQLSGTGMSITFTDLSIDEYHVVH